MNSHTTATKPGTICPICNETLQEGDTLTAYLYAPRNWYVINHRRDGDGYCGIAGFKRLNGCFVRNSLTECKSVPCDAVTMLPEVSE